MISFVVSAAPNGLIGHEWDQQLDDSALPDALSDHLRLDLQQARRGQPSDRFIAVFAVDRSRDSNQLVGLGQVSAANTADLIELAITEHDQLPQRLLRDLFETTVEAHAALHPAVPLRWWTDLPDGPVVDAAAARGFVLERRLTRMEIELAGPGSRDASDHSANRSSQAAHGSSGRSGSPTTRSFDAAADREGLLTLNNRAFADHGEQGGWTMPQLQQRLDEAWFRPEALRVLEIDGSLVGFCWTKPHDGDLGEIYIIGVDPMFAGQGLGSALVLDGLDAIASTGARRAMLWVDADNVRAVRMYERLGFATGRVRSAYLAEGFR